MPHLGNATILELAYFVTALIALLVAMRLAREAGIDLAFQRTRTKGYRLSREMTARRFVALHRFCAVVQSGFCLIGAVTCTTPPSPASVNRTAGVFVGLLLVAIEVALLSMELYLTRSRRAIQVQIDREIEATV